MGTGHRKPHDSEDCWCPACRSWAGIYERNPFVVIPLPLTPAGRLQFVQELLNPPPFEDGTPMEPLIPIEKARKLLEFEP